LNLKTLRLILFTVMLTMLVEYCLGVFAVNFVRFDYSLPDLFTYLLNPNSLRYYLKRSLPIALFTVFLFKTDFGSVRLTLIFDVLVLSLIGVTIWVLKGYFSGVLFSRYTYMRWQYVSSVQWITVFQLLYFTLRRFLYNGFAALNIATQAVWSFGWLHEVLLCQEANKS